MSSKRVLICDDAGFMRTLLRDILTSEGFEVVGEAIDGAMGVLLYEEYRPDLVTMDVNMPKLDGRDALESILKRDPNARVIMVTTAGQDEIIKRTLLAGARDFIIKPFKKHQVVTTLRRVGRDNGTPQTFIEELVAWHELGEMLLRADLITPEVLTAARDVVKRGQARNLFDALKASDTVSEQMLRDALEDGHKEVSMAFLMMKGKVVSMQQLRTTFVMMRKQGKKLGFTLMELGFASKDQVADALRRVPPSRFSAS
ncbi:MAG: response regulator [Candidatus Sericytochromatia bacterium]|nr:response regulator [Candidatus Sericytochromatia bacterium]